MSPEYETGVPVFRPTMDEFHDFRSFVKKIEPIGLTTGVVKIIPPQEWLEKLPKQPTAKIDQIEIRNPITQNLTLGSDRGVFEIENVEMRKKFSVKQWIKQCNTLCNQPPTMRGEKQRLMGRYEAKPGECVTYDDGDFSPEMLAHLESRYWKGFSYGGSPLYGADLPGSLFCEKTTEWNVASLDSLLSALPERIPGVNDAYLYCGMWKATFAWHVEDMDLPSINYIHFGAPKQWYTIPQSHHEKFYQLMSALWPEEQRKCSEFLRHKTFLADPSLIRKHGIPVNQVVHRQREFIITFPYGYHAGFNYGFNIAESVNFAHESWLDIGANAKKCTCVSHSVGIDVQSMIALIKDSAANFTKSSFPIKKHSTLKSQRLGRCVLCPHIHTSHYCANSKGTALAHVDCANLMPETFIVGQTVHGLETIDKERFALKCSHCKVTMGSCFQCSEKDCFRAFHGSCAAAAGVEYNNVSRPLCRYHRPKKEIDSAEIDGNILLSGDIVQYYQDGVYSAGIVSLNSPNVRRLEVTILPGSLESSSVSYEELVSVFAEIPRGPYVEPLANRISITSRKRQQDTKDSLAEKKLKVEVEQFPENRTSYDFYSGTELPSPPKSVENHSYSIPSQKWVHAEDRF